MSKFKLAFVFVVFLIASGANAQRHSMVLPAKSVDHNPNIMLADSMYVAVGRQMNIWSGSVFSWPFGSTITTITTPIGLSYICDVGEVTNRGFRFKPSSESVNTLTITPYTYGLDQVGRSENVQIVAVSETGGFGVKIVMFIGDSLFDGENVHSEVDSLFTLDSSGSEGEIVQIGSQVDNGCYHEAYSGWTWERFTTDYIALPDSNRFWDFHTTNSRLDFKRYSEGYTDQLTPDYVVINLGGNECYIAALAGNNVDVNSLITSAKTFVDAMNSEQYGFRNCKILFNIMNPCCSLMSAWGTSYGATDIALYLKNMKRLRDAYIAEFDNGNYASNTDSGS